MLNEIQFPLALVGSVVAFLIALLWATGIERAPSGDWRVLGGAVSATIAIIAIGIALQTTTAPIPAPTFDTALVVGIVFGVTFVHYLFILPRLTQKFGALIADVINFCGTSFLISAGALWFALKSAGWSSGARGNAVFIALFAFVVGALYGIGRFVEWARDNM